MHLSELINNNYVLSCQLNYVHNIIESDCNLSELFEMFFLRHSVDDTVEAIVSSVSTGKEF